MWVLLPIKAFHLAKQRLSGLLSVVERAQLAQALATDVLTAVAQSRAFERIVVCSSDPAAEAMARFHDAAFLHEARLGANDLNPLVDAAFAHMQANGATECAVLPCDVPLLTAAEIHRFVAAHRAGEVRALTITPDRHGVGTNLLAVRPPDGFRAQYGKDSFLHHCRAARQSARTVCICDLAGAAFDIDEPEDVHELVLHPGLAGAVQTHRFLAESGLIARLARHGIARERATLTAP